MKPRQKRIVGVLCGALILVLLFLYSRSAHALPAYARQTGQNCVACHVSFPELTPYGRLFKLTGYTIGTRQNVPLAAMFQVGMASLKNDSDDQGNPVQPKNRQVVASAASGFLAGKISDNAGAFVQWTASNLNTAADGSTFWHSASDNTDIRWVGSFSDANLTEAKWIYGATLHNNPTVQDVWNSTPAFGFPFTTSPNMVSPGAHTQIEGMLAQQVAGLGGYVFYDRTLYGEVTFYRTADQIFSVLRAGHYEGMPGDVAALQGYNPYFRFAYNREWGPNSLMFGTFGLRVDRYPDDTLQNTPTDRFTDIGVDSQYQYITNEHTFTMQGSIIRERQQYFASYPATLAGAPIGAGPSPANADDRLWSSKIKASYYYQNRYGATLGLFSIRGNADAGLYPAGSVNGSANGSPNSNGVIFELNYLPLQNVRLMMQYTAYNKFNGGTNNYDGSGRNARDNNTLFFNLWMAF